MHQVGLNTGEELGAEGRTLRSKYPGICFGCTESFEAGDQIQWYGNKEVYHFDCRPAAIRQVTSPPLTQDGYLFVDLETGGTNEKKDCIVQLAGIATSNNFVYKSTFQAYINPPENLRLDPFTTTIHGQTRESLKGYKPEAEVIRDFVVWCLQFENFGFAGYNCPFDLRFLFESYIRNGITGSFYLVPPYDPLPIAQRVLKNKTKNHKLVTVAEHFGFQSSGAHNALVDLFMTVGVARELRKIA